MEKLEEILRAEESARNTVADAMAKAKDIVREALAEADLIAAAADGETLDGGAALRTGIIREADAQAAIVERDAEALLASVVSRSEDRIGAAVKAAAEKLVG